MAITIDDFSKIWASSSPLTPYEFSENDYKAGWNFIGATPPSRQMWDFLQKQNDEKLKYLLDNFDDYAKKTDLDDYLPLAGGTMTGSVAFDVTNVIVRSVDDSYLAIFGGSAYRKGAYLALSGKDRSGSSGIFELYADDGTTKKNFSGKPDGTLTWDGKDIITSATVKTFSGNNTYNVSGYKIGRLCIVKFELPAGYTSGWHTNAETILTSNYPIEGFPITVGQINSQNDANAQIRLNLTSVGQLFGYVSATLVNAVQCSCVYISAS